MKHLLVIGYVWPEPATTAAGCRMQQLLETFLTFGYRITFASTATKTEYSLDLETMDIAEATIELNNISFDAFVQKLGPDMVIFDRFMVEEQFGWRVTEFAPQAVRILNTEDLHSLRKAREEALKDGGKFNIGQWKTHPLTLREVASIYRCDMSLMVSTFEMEILQDLGVPEELLLHLPLMYDAVSENTIQKWPPFEARTDFVTLGNGKHAPNVDALRVLKETLWPVIRKQLPQAQLHVYGAYLPQQVHEWNDPNTGFLVHGWVEDVNEILRQAKVLLAPLRFGAGIKGKLLDALRNGTPIMTTTIGAEGLFTNEDWNDWVTNDWEDFAKKAVELYKSPEQWKKAQKQGIDLINNNFYIVKLQNRLGDRLKFLEAHLEDHRLENFMGRLLQNQTLASTKYMAKWIEAKNKKS